LLLDPFALDTDDEQTPLLIYSCEKQPTKYKLLLGWNLRHRLVVDEEVLRASRKNIIAQIGKRLKFYALGKTSERRCLEIRVRPARIDRPPKPEVGVEKEDTHGLYSCERTC
jgi:hypothetical protein